MVPDWEVRIKQAKLRGPAVGPQDHSWTIDIKRLVLGFQIDHRNIRPRRLVRKWRWREAMSPGVGAAYALRISDGGGVERNEVLGFRSGRQQERGLGEAVVVVNVCGVESRMANRDPVRID